MILHYLLVCVQYGASSYLGVVLFQVFVQLVKLR